MTSQTERVASPVPAYDLRPDDRDLFAEMFDAHAHHLFDYCCGLLGDRSQAASTTQVTLIAAHSLIGQLTDPGRMRPWLLALARRECLPGERREQPDDDLVEALAIVGETEPDVTEANTAERAAADIEAAGRRSVRPQLRELPAEQREVLDLVHRHDVSEAELPAVLRISADAAADRLTAATAAFEAAVAAADAQATADAQAAADTRAAADADDTWFFEDDLAPARVRSGPDSDLPALGRLAALPLAGLPASIWRRTARSVLDPRFRYAREAVAAHAGQLGPDGFPEPPAEEDGAPPSRKKLLMASVLLAGLLLAPVAAGAAGYSEFAGVAHAISHLHGSKAVTPPGGPESASSGSSGGPATGRSGHRRTGSAAGRSAGPSAATSLAPHPSVGAGAPSAPGTSKSPKPKPSGSSPSRYTSPASSAPASSSPPSSSASPAPSSSAPSSSSPSASPSSTPSGGSSGTPGASSGSPGASSGTLDLTVLLSPGKTLTYLALP